MKKSFAFLLSATLVLGCFGAFALAQDNPKPKLVIKEPVFDAGEINEGKILKHTFEVYNHGNAVLEIRNVRPG